MCFIFCKNLREIIIPSSATSIGEQSFEGCTNLIEVTIPSSVTNIGNSAFENCSKLEEMIIPSSVTSIGDYFVSGCYSMKRIIIPKTIKQFGIINFENLSLLTEFTIPSCVDHIDDSSFEKCTSLTKIEIPPLVKEIGEKAFLGCKSLTTINIPSVKNIKKYTFAECTSLVEVTISSTVESIANNAFQGCKSLEKIMITKPVKSLPKIEISSNPLSIKVVVVGETSVGKSSILKRICNNGFNIDIPSTIGAELITKAYNVDGNNVRPQIWDTSGEERHQHMLQLYYHSAKCFVVTFDLSLPETLDKAKEYFDEVLLEKYPSFQIILGNKCDLEHKISDEKIREMEQKYNAKYFEVSACSNLNIDEAFEYIARKYFTSITEETNKLKNLINNNHIDDDGNAENNE